MAYINEDVRNIVAQAQLSFVATIDPDGSPRPCCHRHIPSKQRMNRKWRNRRPVPTVSGEEGNVTAGPHGPDFRMSTVRDESENV
ncbi:hypothetical protein GCM10010464_20320 [Pseudonocardia yunnanensis]